MPKVMHIGYSFDPEGAGRGGVVVYQWSLMKALRDLGWDVSFLAGTRHTLYGRMRTRTVLREGIRITELIDSPLRHCDYRCDPLSQTEQVEIDRMTGEIISAERPDIVHIHDPRLHAASLVDVVRGRRIPVLKTVHNYYDLCSQGELMYQGRTICADYEDGARCPTCLSALVQQGALKERLIGTFSGTPVYPVLRGLWRGLQALRRSGRTAPAPVVFPPRAYVERRRYMMERLAALDVLHCSSRRVADLMVQAGVPKEDVRVLPIATGSIDAVRTREGRRRSEELVFCYLTGASAIKGYETLLQAFRSVDQRKARLELYGFRDHRRLARRYAGQNIGFHGAYAPRDLGRVLEKGDVGIVPSVWQEIFGLVGHEFFAAGMPVIASDVGGIGEWLHHEVNGLLVRPGDPADLAASMQRLIDDPALLQRLRQGIERPKSMADHGREIAELYGGLMEQARS